MSRPAHCPRVTVFLRGEFDLSRRDEIAGRIARALDIAGVQQIEIDQRHQARGSACHGLYR